jgi:hypothetical protein
LEPDKRVDLNPGLAAVEQANLNGHKIFKARGVEVGEDSRLLLEHAFAARRYAVEMEGKAARA